MHTIHELIEDFKKGQFVILVDDENRENEGDIVIAADRVTPEAINFMTKEARGLVCLALAEAQVEKLKLPMMQSGVHKKGSSETAFTVSIDARSGITTGISAKDRAHTISIASSIKASPEDLVCPGHIFPLRAKVGGVLERAGHTEASVDLAILAGFSPAAVICEVLNDDGSVARGVDLLRFSDKHSIKIGKIADLIAYRKLNQ